ncbi:MAG: MFS transporter, partial [bacterium]
MGMLQAVAFPCAVRTIGRLFADGERARASGWLGAGMLAGAALAPALTAWLLEQVGPWASAEGIDRWRICLVLYAVPGIVWAAAYWMATRTPTIATAPAATAAAAPMQRTTWLRACGDRPLL